MKNYKLPKNIFINSNYTILLITLIQNLIYININYNIICREFTFDFFERSYFENGRKLFKYEEDKETEINIEQIQNDVLLEHIPYKHDTPPTALFYSTSSGMRIESPLNLRKGWTTLQRVINTYQVENRRMRRIVSGIKDKCMGTRRHENNAMTHDSQYDDQIKDAKVRSSYHK